QTSQHPELALRLTNELVEATVEKCSEIALSNTKLNLGSSSRSILDIQNTELMDGDSAIVMAAGPSLHRNNAAVRIKESGYRGTIIATESAMSHCLRNGLVPHLVVTLDPHPKRIVRWFGDPALNNQDINSDDYYRRQDLDPVFAQNEIERNRE